MVVCIMCSILKQCWSMGYVSLLSFSFICQSLRVHLKLSKLTCTLYIYLRTIRKSIMLIKMLDLLSLYKHVMKIIQNSMSYFRNNMYSSFYDLRASSHLATIQQLHQVLEANLNVLEEVCGLLSINTVPPHIL